MEDSVRQPRNVDGAFAVDKAGMLAGPVPLVDAMVDSRWTLTVAAWLLREAGAAAVHPRTLAYAEHGS